MGVKKNHGSIISAVIIFEPFCKEVSDGPQYKIDHHSRSGEPVRAQRAILKRQIAYVKPSVRAVRIPIEELERILSAGLRPVIPQAEAAR